MDKKVSDLPIKNTRDGTEYVHILDVNDLTDSPQGTDKRALIPLPILQTNLPFNNFKFIQKGFGNIGSQNPPQAGDIYCGWSNDGTTRYHESLYISGTLNNSDNFKPLSQTIL